jgi:hypothetical protein
MLDLQAIFGDDEADVPLPVCSPQPVHVTPSHPFIVDGDGDARQLMPREPRDYDELLEELREDYLDRAANQWLEALPREKQDELLAAACEKSGLICNADHTPAAKLVSGIRCRNCESQVALDVDIHNGRSTRRDCAGCGKFIEFSRWYK